jgi:hypothetical protein
MAIRFLAAAALPTALVKKYAGIAINAISGFMNQNEISTSSEKHY